MLESIGTPCSDRLFAVWGLYALAVTALSALMQDWGYPSFLIWALASAAGLGVALRSEEL